MLRQSIIFAARLKCVLRQPTELCQRFISSLQEQSLILPQQGRPSSVSISASVRILLHADPVSSVDVARPSLARLTPQLLARSPKKILWLLLWRKLSGLNLSEAGVSEPRPPIFLLPLAGDLQHRLKHSLSMMRRARSTAVAADAFPVSFSTV